MCYLIITEKQETRRKLGAPIVKTFYEMKCSTENRIIIIRGRMMVESEAKFTTLRNIRNNVGIYYTCRVHGLVSTYELRTPKKNIVLGHFLSALLYCLR